MRDSRDRFKRTFTLTADDLLQVPLRKHRATRIAWICDHNCHRFMVNQAFHIIKVNFPLPLRLRKMKRVRGITGSQKYTKDTLSLRTYQERIKAAFHTFGISNTFRKWESWFGKEYVLSRVCKHRDGHVHSPKPS